MENKTDSSEVKTIEKG